MNLSNQFQKLKDHWLVILVIVILILTLNNNSFIPNISNKLAYGGYDDLGYVESSVAGGVPSFDGGFAPGVEERKITKSIHESIVVKRNNFEASLSQLDNKISEYKAITLNENVYENNNRKTASYNIKVPEISYQLFISELESFGNIESYTENVNDITGDYLNVQDQIILENQRLDRYKSLMSESKSTEEKISLTDRIFDQERTIKYLEESLKNQNLRIEYVTISLTIQQEESPYTEDLFITLKDIITTFISSLNNVIALLVYVIPWLILIWIVRIFWNKYSRNL